MTTGKSSFRSAVERRSAAAVVFLNSLPRWSLLAIVFVLLAIGMIGTGWLSAVAFLTLAVMLAWLAFLSWPSLGVSGRLLRGITLVVLVAVAVLRAIGRD